MRNDRVVLYVQEFKELNWWLRVIFVFCVVKSLRKLFGVILAIPQLNIFSLLSLVLALLFAFQAYFILKKDRRALATSIIQAIISVPIADFTFGIPGITAYYSDARGIISVSIFYTLLELFKNLLIWKFTIKKTA